jgi:hypothetical protein
MKLLQRKEASQGKFIKSVPDFEIAKRRFYEVLRVAKIFA